MRALFESVTAIFGMNAKVLGRNNTTRGPLDGVHILASRDMTSRMYMLCGLTSQLAMNA